MSLRQRPIRLSTSFPVLGEERITKDYWPNERAAQIFFKYRDVEGYADIDVYMKHGGYEAATKALGMEPDAIIEQLKLSGLRGRGGAGFPTHIKWNGIPKNWDQPHYLVINADEGEPGTAKGSRDHEQDAPYARRGLHHRVMAIRSKQCYIYIRGEYMEPGQSRSQGDHRGVCQGLSSVKISWEPVTTSKCIVHMGAGSYECGEESALMSSLMGERGMPRHKPPSAPLPVISGVWKSPTIINNVETVATVGSDSQHGRSGLFSKWGTERSRGTKLFTISGHVNKPG